MTFPFSCQVLVSRSSRLSAQNNECLEFVTFLPDLKKPKKNKHCCLWPYSQPWHMAAALRIFWVLNRVPQMVILLKVKDLQISCLFSFWLLTSRKHDRKWTFCLACVLNVIFEGQSTLTHHQTVAVLDVQHDILRGSQIKGQFSQLKGLCAEWALGNVYNRNTAASRISLWHGKSLW